MLVICSVSIFLNIRLAERMQQLQDNDMKYRYLLMQGQADGETFDILENKFKWQRDNGFIRSLTDSVMDFEYRIQKQAEALERARLLNEQAEQLKKEADKLGKNHKTGKAGMDEAHSPFRLFRFTSFLRTVFFLELA